MTELSFDSASIFEHMASSSHRLNSAVSEANFKLSCQSVLSKLIPPEKSLIDFILIYDNPVQAEITLPDGRTYCWYFAIGSMINPISLYLRDLIPLMSYPATCFNHRIVFRGATAMADLEVCPGSEFDGVVHLLTNEQMIRLDEIEYFYHRIEINCTNYHGQTHTVYAYQTNINDQSISLPLERYLDIIVKGCEYYRVRPEYIDRLRNEQAVIPRRSPDNFQSFTDVPPDVYYSLEDLREHDGGDPALPLWICMNGKILEHTGLPPADHPDYEFQRNFYRFSTQKFTGQEVTNVMAKALYEPLYQLPSNNEDICDEHRARLEDQYYSQLAGSEKKIYWKPIGRLITHR